ncbi:hypothetical protein [Dyella sp. S184]|nr:hypothetical protein [Dyella sp. S184]
MNNLGNINPANTSSGFSDSVLCSQDYTVQAVDTLASLVQAI